MGSINLESNPGTIPAAGISYEDAMYLRRRGSVEIKLSTECRIEPAAVDSVLLTLFATLWTNLIRSRLLFLY